MFVAIAALILIAILPALVDPEERRAWCQRYFYCRGWDLSEDDDDILRRCVLLVLRSVDFVHSFLLLNFNQSISFSISPNPSSHTGIHVQAVFVVKTKAMGRSLVTFCRLHKKKKFVILSSRIVSRRFLWYVARSVHMCRGSSS